MTIYGRISIWIVSLVVATCSSNGQTASLEIAAEFAKNYTPSVDWIAHLTNVPDSVVIAFADIAQTDSNSCEQYLTLIFLKIYSAHLQCCHQSYELRSSMNNSFVIDRTADPLLFEFNKLTGMFSIDKPVDFISSRMAYDWVRRHDDLRKNRAIKVETNKIAKILKALEKVG